MSTSEQVYWLSSVISFSVDFPYRLEIVCSFISIIDLSWIFVLQHKLNKMHFFLGGGGSAEIVLRARAGDFDQTLEVLGGYFWVMKVCGFE